MRTVKFEQLTLARNYEYSFLHHLSSKELVVIVSSEVLGGILSPGKDQKMPKEFEYKQHSRCSAVQINRFITMGECDALLKWAQLWAWNLSSVNMQKAGERVDKEGRYWLVFTRVYQMHPFHFQGKACLAILYLHLFLL